MNNKLIILFITIIIVILIKFSKAQVKISSVTEGNCVEPKPTPVKFDIMWAMEFGPEAKYVPMGSELYYTYTTKFLRGKPLKNLDEINKMCLNIDSNGFSSTISGFGKKRKLECEIKELGALICGTPELMNNENLKDEQRNSTLLVATWTDHTNYLLTINCFPGGYKSWNVVSNKKTVDETTQNKILKHIKTFGFDPNKAKYLSYKSC